MKYLAKMINNGHVIKSMQFEADTAMQAYSEANDGIDPLSGVWVCSKPAPNPAPRPDPASLAAKPGAVRESNTTGQGDTA